MARIRPVVSLLAFALASSLAVARADAPAQNHGLELGVEAGGLLPLSALGANAVGGVRAGYVLPWLSRRMTLAVDVTFARPTAAGTVTGDGRVAGSQYDWHLGLRELTVMPTLTFDLPRLGPVQPAVGLGPRVYLLQSVVEGSVGSQHIAATTEESTKVGVGLPLSAAYALGPGALVGTLLLEWGPLDQVATGAPTTVAAASLLVGYRLTL